MSIMDLAKKEEALYIQSCPEWNGTEIWQLLFEDPEEGVMEVGLPVLAYEKDGKAALLSSDQIDQYMDYTSETRQDDEEFEPEIIKVV